MIKPTLLDIRNLYLKLLFIILISTIVENKDFNVKKVYVKFQHLKTVSDNISMYDIQSFDIPKELETAFGCCPHGIDGAIDFNIFLKCFPCLKMKSGYVLDYVFDLKPFVSKIYLYARKKEDLPLLTTKQYLARYKENNYDFIDKMEIPFTAEGLFDLALFIMMIQTVYLWDHGNYNYKTFLYTPKKTVLFRNAEYYQDLLKIYQSPYCVFDEDKYSIGMLTQSEWGGVFLTTVSFDKDMKNITFEEENLIEYDCGILF